MENHAAFRGIIAFQMSQGDVALRERTGDDVAVGVGDDWMFNEPADYAHALGDVDDYVHRLHVSELSGWARFVAHCPSTAWRDADTKAMSCLSCLSWWELGRQKIKTRAELGRRRPGSTNFHWSPVVM